MLPLRAPFAYIRDLEVAAPLKEIEEADYADPLSHIRDLEVAAPLKGVTLEKHDVSGANIRDLEVAAPLKVEYSEYLLVGVEEISAT